MREPGKALGTNHSPRRPTERNKINERKNYGWTAGAGISLLPASGAENSRAAVIGCRVRDKMPICEIALALGQEAGNKTRGTVQEVCFSKRWC